MTLTSHPKTGITLIETVSELCVVLLEPCPPRANCACCKVFRNRGAQLEGWHLENRLAPSRFTLFDRCDLMWAKEIDTGTGDIAFCFCAARVGVLPDRQGGLTGGVPATIILPCNLGHLINQLDFYDYVTREASCCAYVGFPNRDLKTGKLKPTQSASLRLLERWAGTE